MKLTVISRLLAAAVCAFSLPACFMTSPSRVTELPPKPPIDRPRATTSASRLPYAYGEVVPYRDPRKTVEQTAKRPPQILPPPDPLPIESPQVTKVPKLELQVEPVPETVKRAVSQSISVEPTKAPLIAVEADPPLVVALRQCYEKRVDSALETLKAFDPINQEALLTLLPITVRMSEGSLAQADPQELAIILDQLQSLVTSLQPRAALRLEKLGFCKQIRKFGVFEPVEGKPSFRSGDMVEVYGELCNISCERQPSRIGEYRTRTNSTLEIREAGGNSGWRKEVAKTDVSQTAQHDFYHHYRFQLPELNPGPYVLSVEVVDLPTGRKVRQKLEFRVMP